MKIAIIGIRGIPVAYSTFETLAEALSAGLVKRKHNMYVYCRKAYSSSYNDYHNIGRIVLPSIETKHLSTFAHSLISTLHACLFTKYDLILYLGVGSTIFSLFPRVFGTKTIVHINGVDWERKKWGKFAQWYLKMSVLLTTVFPNAVISDNPFMISYYKKLYKKEIPNISYGYFPPKIGNYVHLLKKYGLKKRGYFVWVGRIVPENHLEELIDAFVSQKTNIRCLVIGDDHFESRYKTKIYSLIDKDKRIVRTGFIKHQEVLSLVSNSFAYVETKRNGGTQMALIEAMGTGTVVISNDNLAHINVLGKDAIYYNETEGGKSLMKVLKKALLLNPGNLSVFRTKIKKRAIDNYQWTKIIKLYEELFYKVTK